MYFQDILESKLLFSICAPLKDFLLVTSVKLAYYLDIFIETLLFTVHLSLDAGKIRQYEKQFIRDWAF